MKLGFGLPVSGGWATRANIVQVARQAEALGYDSLWTFQRLLHPAEGDWGPMYHAVQDPIVTLAHVAAITERVRLGVAVVNAPFYSPVVLAKQFATLDELSAGRLDAGLGLGWAREEFAAVGVPYQHRGARTAEFIQCLKAIWTSPVVSFNGTYYQMPPSRVDPKPVQQPHPPLLLGGTAERALQRAGRLGDGWISSSRHDLKQIGSDIGTIRDAAAAAGRDPDRLRFVVRGVVRLQDGIGDGSGDDAAGRRPLHGTASQITGDLERLEAAGVTEVFFDLNFDPEIVAEEADPAASMARADTLLQTFART
jgi:probable F420-dependent oxidoreductase